MNRIKHFIRSITLLFFIVQPLTSCETDQDFVFDTKDLVNTQWGIPQIIEPGDGPFDLSAPTIFHEDGTVSIGTARNDLWSLRGERSIFLEQSRENWFIIELTPDRFYVEKTSYPDGQFIVKCIYEPM